MPKQIRSITVYSIQDFVISFFLLMGIVITCIGIIGIVTNIPDTFLAITNPEMFTVHQILNK